MADSPAAELELDESEVRSLIRRAAPALGDLPLSLVADGWDNITWRLGDELAVRLPRRRLAAALIEHEQQALPLLAPALESAGVTTPLPILNGAPDEAHPWPWSIVPWITGVRALDRSREANAAWAPHLAVALLALHRPAPAEAPVNPVRGVPLAVRDAANSRRIDGLDENVAHVLRDAWQAGRAAPESQERVWIHGDLHPGNILVEDDRLKALIDFGDVTAGDPAYDLAVAWQAFTEEGRAAFRACLGERYDAATWTRARAWAACVAGILLDASDDRDEYRALAEATAAELARDRPCPRPIPAPPLRRAP